MPCERGAPFSHSDHTRTSSFERLGRIQLPGVFLDHDFSAKGRWLCSSSSSLFACAWRSLPPDHRGFIQVRAHVLVSMQRHPMKCVDLASATQPHPIWPVGVHARMLHLCSDCAMRQVGVGGTEGGRGRRKRIVCRALVARATAIASQ